jgi:predicted transcriptional regulator
MDNGAPEGRLLALTTEIVAAYLQKNPLPAGDVATLINVTHRALSTLSAGPSTPAEPMPAVPIRKSVFPDHIVCLEDGKKLKTLRRHLQSEHGMTPAQYRAKWHLPNDYPIVAPAYAARRSSLAKQIGLGQTRRERKPVSPAPAATPAPKPARGRRKPEPTAA